MSIRLDRIGPITFGATPIKVTPEGFRHYEGTATIGDVVLPYSDPPHLEFRPASEVCSAEAVQSMEGAPLTYEHPSEMVSPDNAKEHTEGAVLKAWREEDECPRIRVRVVVYTRPLQEAIEGGKVELSPGYNCDPEDMPGDWKGQRYHVVQRRVRYNHLAVVDRARTRTPAGEVARLDQDDTTMTTDNNRTDGVDLASLGFSEAAIALFAQLPEADAKALQDLAACKMAESAEEEAKAAGASAEEAEMAEEAAKQQMAGSAEENPTMDDVMMDKLSKMMDEKIAAAVKGAAPAAAPAPAAPAAKKDSDDIAVAAMAKLRTQIAGDLRAERADFNLVRKDSADLLGVAGDDDHRNVKATMLAEVKRSTPEAEGPMKRALDAGRMDDARDLYRTAVAVRNAKRLDSQIETFGDLYTDNKADNPFAAIAGLKIPG